MNSTLTPGAESSPPIPFPDVESELRALRQTLLLSPSPALLALPLAGARIITPKFKFKLAAVDFSTGTVTLFPLAAWIEDGGYWMVAWLGEGQVWQASSVAAALANGTWRVEA